MKVPTATYRIQFSSRFPLEDFQRITGYLRDLGISTIYAAPFFQARKGSTHGYDVLDPFTINKEIGRLEAFKNIAEWLKKNDMTWLQDIVPNHMAFDSRNPWLHDIFELGPDSPYFRFFDISWNHRNWNKVMAPFLGSSLEEALANQELHLELGNKGFYFRYFDHWYPASAASYPAICSLCGMDQWKRKLEEFQGNDTQWQDIKAAFLRDVREEPTLKQRVESTLKNLEKGMLRELLDQQYFLLTHWQHTEEEINYRRFFTINDLICLRMEDQEVFRNYHHYIRELCNLGLVSGLRIDHIDGLFDPRQYIQDLRNILGQDFYIVVEKILEHEEKIPGDWSVQGTSGYDFLAQVNQLFTWTENHSAFTEAFENIDPEMPRLRDLVFQKKRFILENRMGGELQNLLDLLEERHLLPEQHDPERWRQALIAFLAGFPVYRIYPREYPLNQQEREVLEIAFTTAMESFPELAPELGSLRDLFFGEAGSSRENMLYFLKRCQQFTGPLAAKGVEDTVFYIFNRLISHNEVGDSPENFGITTEEFHRKMSERQKQFPASISATATHDTKRGEDARMRLDVLSEIPEQWFSMVEKWRGINKSKKKDQQIPGPGEEYFIYQVLVGGMSFGPEAPDFLARTQEYMQKVLREAKVHSSWSEPDPAYEEQVFRFIGNVLEDRGFRDSFDPFQREMAHYGVLKSLAQTLLKVTCPGLPDMYQGTELWDLSYVDPDNRRPVDYDLRKSFLGDLVAHDPAGNKQKLQELARNYSNGKIKMYTLYKALKIRRENPELFEKGEYMPLRVSGAEGILAFARRKGDRWLVVVVPVLVTPLFQKESLSPKSKVLESAMVHLPRKAPGQWENIYTGDQVEGNAGIDLEPLLKEFPVVLLQPKTTSYGT